VTDRLTVPHPHPFSHFALPRWRWPCLVVLCLLALSQREASSEPEVQQLRARVSEAEKMYKRAHNASLSAMGRQGHGARGSVDAGDIAVQAAMRAKRVALLAVQEHKQALRVALMRARLKWGVGPLTEQVDAGKALLVDAEKRSNAVTRCFLAGTAGLQHGVPTRLRALLRHFLQADANACERANNALLLCESQLAELSDGELLGSLRQPQAAVALAEDPKAMANMSSQFSGDFTQRTKQDKEKVEADFFDPFAAAVEQLVSCR